LCEASKDAAFLLLILRSRARSFFFAPLFPGGEIV